MAILLPGSVALAPRQGRVAKTITNYLHKLLETESIIPEPVQCSHAGWPKMQRPASELVVD
jgi:hypothetical protein